MRKNTITVGYSPPGSHRRLRWIAATVGVIVAVGLLAGSFVVGRATAPGAESVRPVAGSALRHGIPVPDRHTPAGAATAAANFQIAGFRVNAGTLDASTAVAVLLSDDADESARAVLATPTTDVEQLRQTRSSFAPLSTVVTGYDSSRATVQVWGVSTTSSRVRPQPGGTETWGRSTVELTWAGSQWRVRTQDYERGPWPVRSDERLTDADGDFSFRFRELTQQGWSYVPEP
ncbi:hypothetical protein [Actinophytocola sp.]|uniref:hypothetical protein n=1 Tax=Actinophytocola sp. TaxID=1872138 RepID=UPI00389A9D0C